MKTRLLHSVLCASLLLSSASFAASMNDSVKTLKDNSSQEKVAQAKIKTSNANEAYLAKVKTGAFKKEANADETKRLNKIVNNSVKEHEALLKKVPKEFTNGLNNTVQALKALHSNKIQEAQKLLQKADKDFQAAFKANPSLKLIPVADNAEIISFNGDAALIKHIKDASIKLLEENDTQIAIEMIASLQDEMIIKTQYVPVYLYPDAIQKALQNLKNNKKKEAFTTLITALNATQVDTLIIPIPLITAQDMIQQASKIEKTHKKEALALLSKAQDELEKATLLGYTQKDSQTYESINKQIKALKTEINGKNVVVKLYDELLKSFQKLHK
jgi:hypothetical protein